MGRVVELDLREHNMVLAGHDRYFLLRADGQTQLVRDSCPHRGGPLSLARLTTDGRRLSCPWHGTKIGVAALRRTAVPMVRSGDRAMAILADVAPEAPLSVIRREILANLPPVVLCEDLPIPSPQAAVAGTQDCRLTVDTINGDRMDVMTS
jgi:hypothetical protein